MAKARVKPDYERVIQACLDHESWLASGGAAGYRADFSDCDLSEFNLSEFNLSGAYTHNAIFRKVE